MFEGLDAVFLARLQFAFTVSFHFIFPSFSIGLASFLAVLEALLAVDGPLGLSRPVQVLAKNLRARLRHGRRVGHRDVLSVRHQLVGLSPDKAGPVIGPLMAYEVLTAFFLEAGFLGVMLFGMNSRRQGTALHGDTRRRRRDLHLGLLDPRRQ